MELVPFETLTAGAVGVAALVVGLVQFLKAVTGIEGKGAVVATFVIGLGFAGLREAMAQDLIPAVALPWIRVALVGLVGALAANGFYKLTGVIGDKIVRALVSRGGGDGGGGGE